MCYFELGEIIDEWTVRNEFSTARLDWQWQLTYTTRTAGNRCDVRSCVNWHLIFCLLFQTLYRQYLCSRITMSIVILLAILIGVILFNEYLIYYIVLYQVWHHRTSENIDEKFYRELWISVQLAITSERLGEGNDPSRYSFTWTI